MLQPTYPGSTKDVPFVYLQVFAKFFTIFHEVPSGVFLEGRDPRQTRTRLLVMDSRDGQPTERTEWTFQHRAGQAR